MEQTEIRAQHTIDDVYSEVSALKDLFLRRLVDDKIKAAALDKLSQANDNLNQALNEKHFITLAKELFLICDRIEAKEECSPFEHSIRDEIIEVLERRGISVIAYEPQFNPIIHNAVKGIPSTEEHPANSIVAVIRNGYHFGETIVRPVDVIVASDRL